MKRQIKEWIVFILIILLVIGLLTMFSKWRRGEYDGSIMDELVPAIFIGLFISWMVLLIVSNIFKHSSNVWFITSGLAFVLSVAYQMLHLDATIGIYIIMGIIAILMLMVIVMWIGEKF